MNAESDIGYANTCYGDGESAKLKSKIEEIQRKNYGDFSSATAYNPKLKLKRTKTLMEGHDCCFS